MGQGQRVAVAMSGGVDSSTVAALLQRQGYQVFGITMRLFPPLPGGTEPATDARRVAAQLGIEHHLLDLSSAFQEEIITPFAAEYQAGRTPNPCARCNRLVKFGRLLAAARELGGDLLATGHYVRSRQGADGSWQLLTAADPAKDQSYFLFSLTQADLAQLLFPLGEYSKPEVRRLAAEFHLPVAEKGESQDVCFIPDGDYVHYLESRCGVQPRPGEFVHVDGRVLGRHGGVHRYTIGQRRGLGIAWSEPLYVVAIDAAINTVRVGPQAALATAGLRAVGVNWLQPPPAASFASSCKIRYRHRPAPCTVTPLPGGEALVRFAVPENGVTPGQAVVFYAGEQVLGGGWIAAPLGAGESP